MMTINCIRIAKEHFFNITLNELLAKLQTLRLCKGIKLSEIKRAHNVRKHVIPKKIRHQQYLATANQQRKYAKEYQRSRNCEMLWVNEIDTCKPCRDNSLKLKYKNQRKISKSLEPAKLKAPVSFTSPERLVLTLKQQRLRNKQLEEHIEKMKLEIEASGKHINEMVTLYLNADSKVVLPFMKLFCEKQQKYLITSKTGRRYHPMIIKCCLALAAKSSSAYSELRYDPEKGWCFSFARSQDSERLQTLHQTNTRFQSKSSLGLKGKDKRILLTRTLCNNIAR